MLENAAESHPSSARFVRWRFLLECRHALKRNHFYLHSNLCRLNMPTWLRIAFSLFQNQNRAAFYT